MKRGFEIDDDIRDKIDVLDPKFREQIESIFSNVNKSIMSLYDKATVDEKTGLYTHKFFQKILEKEIEKAKDSGLKMCLFMLDIDHFKKINETYGHIKADELLQKLGEVLKEETRSSDIMARFGGEEFVLLMLNTGIEEAKEITSRIRTSIKESKELKKCKLTVSGGLTEFSKKDEPEDILIRADDALRIAKDSGRDRFVSIGLNMEDLHYESGKIKPQKKRDDLIKIKKLGRDEIIGELREIYHG